MKNIKNILLLGSIILVPHAAQAIILLEDDAVHQLINAAYENDDAAVQRLITHENARVDGIEYGATALYKAAEEGSTDAAEVLLSNDANVNFINRHNGMTPLMIAAKNGQEVIVRMLLNTGKVDTSIVDNAGNTALFYANGRQDIVAMIEQASR